MTTTNAATLTLTVTFAPEFAWMDRNEVRNFQMRINGKEFGYAGSTLNIAVESATRLLSHALRSTEVQLYAIGTYGYTTGVMATLRAA